METREHKILSDSVVLALQTNYKNKIRIFKRDVVRWLNGKFVHYGEKGMSDLYGAYTLEKMAAYFEIEVKTKTQRLNPAQKKRFEVGRQLKYGCFTAYSVKELLEEFDAWVKHIGG